MLNLIIKNSSNQIVQLHPGMPPGVSFSLPGKNAWFSNNKYGLISFEEFQTGGLTIRSSFFRFAKKMTLYCKMPRPLVSIRIAMFNKWNVGIRGEDNVMLSKNQFVIYYPGKKEEKLVFEKDKEYRSFEILCAPEKLAAVVDLFPTVAAMMEEMTENKQPYMHAKPLMVPHSALDLLSNAKEIATYDVLASLFSFLLEAVEHKLEDELPMPHEKAAVETVEKIITTDIRLHHKIPELAKKVNLSEYRLKYVFRHINKTSIYKYLLKLRMIKAKELLETTNDDMKEIAGNTGYKHITSFITTFRKYWNYTPRTLRR